MWRNRLVIIGYILVVIVITGLLGVIPDIGPSLGLTFFVVGLELCAVGLVLSGLQRFQTAFKKVYYLITTGICLSALATIVASAFSLSKVDEGNAWNIISNILSTSGIAVMYWGLVRLSRLIGGASAVLLTGVLFGIACLAGLALAYLAHPANQLPEFVFDLQNFLDLLVVPCSLLGVYLALTSKRQVSARYAPMVSSLGWAFTGITIGILTEIAASFTELSPSAQGLLAMGGSMVFIIAILKAAYDLRKSTIDDGQRNDAATMIDVNIYLASLASSPERIDRILDPMRGITAFMSPSSTTAIAPEAKKTLQEVHNNLIAYLTTTDPIRSFSEQELRETIHLKFGDTWMRQ